MTFTRRDFAKLAAAALPAASLLAKPNSVFGGVQIGVITYSFRALPSSAEEVLKYCLDCGISGVELTYSQTQFGDKTRELYLLSDFSIVRERRISKLIPMIATCREVMEPINRRLLIRVERISTTAFTTNAVSMKYRGIFELDKRTPDH